jgi:predicted site-specific integrase-resolvase
MNDTLLYGWKEIAKFIGCSVATAKRYHRKGLPLYRMEKNGTVQGIPGDILDWLRTRKTPAR